MPNISWEPSVRIGLLACLVLTLAFLSISWIPTNISIVDEANNTINLTNGDGSKVKDDTYLANANLDSQSMVNEEPMILPAKTSGREDITSDLGSYRVLNGDSLYLIAQHYDTTVAQLKELNGLQNDLIRPGQDLNVPLHSLKEYPVGLKLTNGEVRWIAQMIHAEAKGEPYLGQVAVGAVIVNRVKSPRFPNTVRDVLFQRNAFEPVLNGSFFQPAKDSAYRAAVEALNGADPTNGALFFFNPKQSQDRFMHARPAVVTIGQHRFMY